MSDEPEPDELDDELADLLALARAEADVEQGRELLARQAAGDDIGPAMRALADQADAAIAAAQRAEPEDPEP